MKSDMKSEDNNVIDMTERIKQPDYRERLKHLKVRLDLEHAKVAVSTSLLSIVLLVTLANNNMLKSPSQPTNVAMNVESQIEATGRNPAAFGVATHDPVVSVGSTSVDEGPLVAELAKRELGSASLGRKPNSLERLAFEFLEGKYAVRLHNGKISEIEFSDLTGAGEKPKHISNLIDFLNSHRELLPVDFEKPLKVGAESEGSQSTETYQLINRFSMPVAQVQFRVNSDGGLLGMRIGSAPATK